MSSSFTPREDVFPDVFQHWDLDRLYSDLTTAKRQYLAKTTSKLTDTERIYLRGLLQGVNPKEMAALLHCQPQGLRVALTRGLYRYIEVLTHLAVENWRDVATLLAQRGYRRSPSGGSPEGSPEASSLDTSPTLLTHPLTGRQDWGHAPDVYTLWGRTAELAQLEQWIMGQSPTEAHRQRCRLVAVLGMGGIGKTSLSLQLAHQIQDQFDWVIWRSLLNAPPLEDLLQDLLQTFASQSSTQPLDWTAALSQLLHHLKTHRCLLILDNAETILQGGQATGSYRPGYEDYGQLLRQIGQVPHQSCLLLTSRETPKEIAQLEGALRPVQSMKLTGLHRVETQQIFAAMGAFSASESDWQQLTQLYAGNPLALELVAKHIVDIFDGDIPTFLTEGTPLFHDVQDLLDWHFDRLSPLEQEVMYWLAINREPVSIAELREDIVAPQAKQQVSATVQSLKRRFPLQQTGLLLTQPPAVMEYITYQLMSQMCDEIRTGTIRILNQYACLKARSKDYIRESQSRVLVDPILAHLQSHWPTPVDLIHQLDQILAQLRSQFAQLPGYAAGNLLHLFHRLDADLTGYDFSNLSIWQAYLADTNLYRVNFTGSSIEKSVFAETFGGVTRVNFSPDSAFLATSDTSGGVQVWSMQTRQRQFTLQADTVWTWDVAFSRDGQQLVTAGDDYQVKVWDAQTGQCLQVLTGHHNTVNAVMFSPTQPLLASCGQDATIRLWAMEGCKDGRASCVGLLQGHQGRVWSIAFSPNGQTLVSGSEDSTVKRWDVRTGTCLGTWTGHRHWVKSIAYSPDGHWIASGSFDGEIKLWRAATGTCEQTWLAHEGTVTALTFRPPIASCPSPLLLASSSYDQTVKIWEIPTATCIRTWPAHRNRIWSIAYSPDGQWLASGGDDHATCLWEAQTGYSAQTWKGYTNGILALALNADQTCLATGHEDQTVKVWHPSTGQLLHRLRGHTHHVWAVAFAPANATYLSPKTIASGSADRTLKLWNHHTGECLRTFAGHKGWVWSVAFSPSGNWLASGSYDHTIRLWEPRTGECLNVLTGHTAPVVTVAFSPDGRTLASSSFDATIKCWHLPTGRCVQTLQGHTQSVWSIAFSPDGEQLVSCSYDQTVKQWDLKTGRCLQTFTDHSAPVLRVAFSPDGTQLASGGFDRVIRVWDLASGQLLHRLEGHTKPILDLSFAPALSSTDASAAPRERSLWSGGLDETVQVWDLDRGICLRQWRDRRPYEAMQIGGVKGLSDAQRATLLALGAILDRL